MHIKDIKNKLKVLKKRAQGSVGTAIKVLTATVLGASILVGGYALTNEVVLPNTTEKVESMFAYSADAEGNVGGSGTVEPTPNNPQIGDVRTFTFSVVNITLTPSETVGTAVYNYEYGDTWEDWCNGPYASAEIVIFNDPDEGKFLHGISYGGDPIFDATEGSIPKADTIIDETHTYEICLMGDAVEDFFANAVESDYQPFGEEKTINIHVTEEIEGWNEDYTEQFLETGEYDITVTYRDGMTWANWEDYYLGETSDYNIVLTVDDDKICCDASGISGAFNKAYLTSSNVNVDANENIDSTKEYKIYLDLFYL